MLFSSKISQTRPAAGCEGAFEAGKSGGGRCYGYRVVRSLKDGMLATGDREVFVEEAAIVQKIFREYASGMSPKAIAKRLNAEHTKGAGRGRRGIRARFMGASADALFASGRRARARRRAPNRQR